MTMTLNAAAYRLIFPIALALPLFCLTHPAGAAPQTGSTAVIDRDSAELLQSWLAGEPVPAASTAPQSDALVDWRAYLRALSIPDAARREKSLRDVYKHTSSPLLRMIVLRNIAESPEYQGRQAAFIRRYGFYANWFNRVVYSASLLIQGNLQVVAQLVVNGVNDLADAIFSSGVANVEDRRAYDLMRRAQAMGASSSDRAKLAKLERIVTRALAQSDFDQAQYALGSGDPEAAAFYAGQAFLLRPEWTKAENLQRKAESEVARLRRDQIASSQVGYPDRNPPVELDSPELLRGVLAGSLPRTAAPPRHIFDRQFLSRMFHHESQAAKTADAAGANERLVTAVLRDLAPPQAGQATMMRSWKTYLKNEPEGYAHRWLTALIYDPKINVDARLNQARSQWRGNVFKYIFLGSERPREQVYKTATWITEAWSAMQNIGIFYVFEVAARAGQSLWSTPVPAEEVLDAQAAWLRQAPDLQNKEARKLAWNLYKSDMAQDRFEDARRVLEKSGLLTASRTKKINHAYANWLLDTAQKMAAGTDRDNLVLRIEALAPGTATAKKAKKIAETEKKHAETQQLVLDWDAMARWTGVKPPCGLPGEPGWFDGRDANGEAAPTGLTMERRDGEPQVTLRYQVAYPDGRRVFQIVVPFKKLPQPVQRWFELSTTQRTEASQTLKQLNRLPIPFALEGGAGPSGVDFYPKLLPIQTKPGEIELYR